MARLCDSAWRVRCTPARLNIATTITEDPIVPTSPPVAVSVVRRVPGELQNFRSQSGIGYDLFASARGPREPGPGRFRSQFADPEARPARGCRCGTLPRAPRAHTRSRTNGRSAVKTGARAASQPSMEPVETSGPSRHTVSSHAPGAGRGKPLSVRMTRRRRGFTRHDADEGGGTYVHVARFSVTTTRRDDTHTGSPSRKSS